MSDHKDPFIKDLAIALHSDRIVIDTREKRSVLAILLLFACPVFACIGILVLVNQVWADGLFFLALGIGCGFFGWKMFADRAYPITVLSLRPPQVERPSKSLFHKDIIIPFMTLTDISFTTKAVGGGVSAYEEGNTDFRKRMILVTDQGDIPILTYYSRSRDIENSAQEFARLVKSRFTTASE